MKTFKESMEDFKEFIKDKTGNVEECWVWEWYVHKNTPTFDSRSAIKFAYILYIENYDSNYARLEGKCKTKFCWNPYHFKLRKRDGLDLPPGVWRTLAERRRNNRM